MKKYISLACVVFFGAVSASDTGSSSVTSDSLSMEAALGEGLTADRIMRDLDEYEKDITVSSITGKPIPMYVGLSGEYLAEALIKDMEHYRSDWEFSIWNREKLQNSISHYNGLLLSYLNFCHHDLSYKNLENLKEDKRYFIEFFKYIFSYQYESHHPAMVIHTGTIIVRAMLEECLKRDYNGIQLQKQLTDKESESAQRGMTIEQQTATIDQQSATIAQRDQEIATLHEQAVQSQEQIAAKDADIAEKTTAIEEKDQHIADLEARIAQLETEKTQQADIIKQQSNQLQSVRAKNTSLRKTVKAQKHGRFHNKKKRK